MSFLCTIFANEALSEPDVKDIAAGLPITRREARAADVASPDRASLLPVLEAAQAAGHDGAILPAENREKRLLICDMDSTVIGQECLDELATLAGCGEEIAAVTERAMRGELDFETALTERVARLEGTPAHLVDEVLRDRLSLNAGAACLVQTMRARGAITALVSGGFTLFTGPIANRAGFEAHHGNRLDVRDGVLTGNVIPPILGRDAKRAALLDYAATGGFGPQDAVAIGDGANDLAMIEAAGLGIAFRAKPVVAAAADAAINNTDLSAALAFQGIPISDWVR